MMLGVVLVSAVLARVVWSSSIGFAQSEVLAQECRSNCSALHVLVRREGEISTTQSVQYSTEAANATSAKDFVAVQNQTLTFQPNQSQRNISISIISDGVYEDYEFFLLRLHNPSTGVTLHSTNSTTTVGIEDAGDAGLISFGSSVYYIREDAGEIVIPISRTGGKSSNISVLFKITNPLGSTALVGSDYIFPSSGVSIDFLDGQVSSNLTIAIRNDTIFEYHDEFFKLEIADLLPKKRYSGDSVPLLGSIKSARIFILDDDDAGIFSFTKSEYYCREDNETAVVTIVRNGGFSTSSYADIKLTVETVKNGGNATSGGSNSFDYEHKIETLNWKTNELRKTFSFVVFNNKDYQKLAKTVKVKMTAVVGGGKIDMNGRNESLVHIIDDRDAGTFSFKQSNYDVYENGTSVVITVTRTGISKGSAINTYSSGVVSVDISTVNGTILPDLKPSDYFYDYGIVKSRGCTHVSPCSAFENVHFNPVSSTTLTFSDNQTSQTITVFVKNNNLFEAPSRVFKLIMRNVTGGAHIGQDLEHPTSWKHSINLPLEPLISEVMNFTSTVVTILDDNDPAVIISKASISINEIGQFDSYFISLNSRPNYNVTIRIDAGNEVEISASIVHFNRSNWNRPVEVVVKANDNYVTEGTRTIRIKHAAFSLDLNYNGQERYQFNASGCTFGKGIYTQNRGSYDSGNPFHEFLWEEKNNSIITAPSSALVVGFVVDNDVPGVLVKPEMIRFTQTVPHATNLICIRDAGHNATYKVQLISEPKSIVNVTAMVSHPLLVSLQPSFLKFSSSNWNITQSINVSSIGLKQSTNTILFYITHISTSEDFFYSDSNKKKLMPILFGEKYGKVEVSINDNNISLRENEKSYKEYSVTLKTKPMHWENHRMDKSVNLYHCKIYSSSDITISNTYLTHPGNLQFLYTADNGTNSSSSSSTKYVSLLEFPIEPHVKDETKSVRNGLVVLKIYRLQGGENAGLGGIGIKAKALLSDLDWNEDSWTANCSASFNCSFFDDQNISNLMTLDNIRKETALDPMAKIEPTGFFDTTANQYRESNGGWLEIDVTAIVNDYVSKGKQRISFLLYSGVFSTYLENGVDQVQIASKNYYNSSLHPHLFIRASGAVNIGKNMKAIQSQPGNPQYALDNYSVKNQSLKLGRTSMSAKVADSPWWEVDLEYLRIVERIQVTIKKRFQGENSNSTVDVWVLLSVKRLSGGNIDGLSGLHRAKLNALYKRKFTIHRNLHASNTDTATINWNVAGERGLFVNNSFYPGEKPVEIRFVKVQIEGKNSLEIIEAGVFQESMSTVRINIHGYLPSPSTLSRRNQISILPCDKSTCTAYGQCRNELLFTSYNYNLPQKVKIIAINNYVATGYRALNISHFVSSSDVDFQENSLCYPTKTKICNNDPTNRKKNYVSVHIEDDDEIGIVMSRNKISLVEGSANNPGSFILTKSISTIPPQVRCSDNRLIAYNSTKSSTKTSCLSTLYSTPWSTFLNTSAPYLSLESAWMFLDFGKSRIISHLIFNVPNIPKTLATKTVSIWISINGSLQNINFWRFIVRYTLPLGSVIHNGKFQTKQLELSTRYMLIVVEDSYEITEKKRRQVIFPSFNVIARQILSFPMVRGDISKKNGISTQFSRLSRMHLPGKNDRILFHLASEPVAPVIVYPIALPTRKIAVYEFSNSSQIAGHLERLLIANYSWGSFSSILSRQLYFNASNWNVSQALVYTCVDNNIYEGNGSFYVTHGVLSNDSTSLISNQASNSGPADSSKVKLSFSFSYNNANFFIPTEKSKIWPNRYKYSWKSKNGSVKVSMVDDDLPGITISCSTLKIKEDDKNVNQSIYLDSAPKFPVIVSVSLNSDSLNIDLHISPKFLVFNSSTWYIPQYFYLSAVQNTLFEGIDTFTLKYNRYILKKKNISTTYTVTSADLIYNKIEVGGNDPTLPYHKNQAVLIFLEDDDTGCLSEYPCLNGGNCTNSTVGNICQCTEMFGMRDCSKTCKDANNCKFIRLAIVLECHPENVDAICTSQLSPEKLMSSLHSILTDKGLRSPSGLLYEQVVVNDSRTSMYLKNHTKTKCLRDASLLCFSIIVEIENSEGQNIEKRITQLEQNRELKYSPYFIESIKVLDIYDRVRVIPYIMWSISIFGMICVLAVITIVVKRYAVIKKGSPTKQTSVVPN